MDRETRGETSLQDSDGLSLLTSDRMIAGIADHEHLEALGVRLVEQRAAGACQAVCYPPRIFVVNGHYQHGTLLTEIGRGGSGIEPGQGSRITAGQQQEEAGNGRPEGDSNPAEGDHEQDQHDTLQERDAIDLQNLEHHPASRRRTAQYQHSEYQAPYTKPGHIGNAFSEVHSNPRRSSRFRSVAYRLASG